jgi:phenylacetate-CoA ligase
MASIDSSAAKARGAKARTGAANLALQQRLEESQRWPAEKLLKHQLDLASRLVAHAAATVPYYRERLAEAGVRIGQRLDFDAWRRLPVLTRRELQAAGDALNSRKIPPAHGKLIKVMSSGSTGTPVSVLATQFNGFHFKAIVLRSHLWARRDFSLKFALIRRFKDPAYQYPSGASSRRWGEPITFPFPTGPSVRLHIGTSVAQQIEWLGRQDPHYLLTYPSNLRELARHSLENGIRLPNLKEVATMAEILTPETREIVREAWGVPINDSYSAQEIGGIALQCPEHEHYHVQGEALIVEVLDETGRLCGPGEVGRLYVTPFFNYATPLIRYELGDYAEVGEPCPCGRTLPVLKRILGRTRNTLVLPDGRRFWPHFGSRSLRKLAPIVQHQYVQTEANVIEARLVTERPLTPAEEEALRASILGNLPIPYDIKFAYYDEIPRSAGGKYEDFISAVATP